MTNRPLPTSSQLLTPIAAGAAVVLLAATLTGCSQMLNELKHVHEESHTTYTHADTDWVGVDIPAWIPDDATGLHNYATTNETQAVIGVGSSSEPIGCVDAPRRSLPFATTDWAPAEALELPDCGLISDVLQCGDYEVVAYGEGWVGWFSAQQEGQTPSS